MVPIYPTGGPRHAAPYPPLPPRPPLPPLSPPPPRRSRTGVVVSILVTAAVALAVGTAGGYAVGSGKAVAAASASASATRSTLFSSAVSSCGSPAGTQLGDGGPYPHAPYARHEAAFVRHVGSRPAMHPQEARRVRRCHIPHERHSSHRRHAGRAVGRHQRLMDVSPRRRIEHHPDHGLIWSWTAGDRPGRRNE